MVLGKGLALLCCYHASSMVQWERYRYGVCCKVYGLLDTRWLVWHILGWHNNTLDFDGDLLAGDIRLIAYERDTDVGCSELPRLFQPPAEVVESVSAGHVEDQQRASRVPVV